jgi:predicted ATPase
LRLLHEARGTVARTGEAYFAAEVHRLAGELILASDRPDQAAAEAALREGLAIAQAQRARLFALRTGVSLARLWCRQGRRGPARELLAELCNSFEGAAGPDLAEAQAFLAAA